MSKKLKHILVIRLSAMGDVAMTVPVLHALTERYKDLEISVLTRASFAPLFNDLENTKVINADLKGRHKGVLGIWRLSRELKRHKFDAVADLHNVLRTDILKLFLGLHPFSRIDKGRKEKKELISGQRFEQLKTTHQRYADVFADIGLPMELSGKAISQKKELTPQHLSVIGEYDRLIGIAPFAAFGGKVYPSDLMKEVISELQKDFKIVLFGGGKLETKKLNEMANNSDRVINLSDKFSLEDELDIISNLDLMISMDSGNAHLAAMMGTEVVTLWGVTHPYAGFYPYGQKISNALQSDRQSFPQIPTSVYGNKYPQGYEDVMRTIKPNDVVSKVRSILK